MRIDRLYVYTIHQKRHASDEGGAFIQNLAISSAVFLVGNAEGVQQTSPASLPGEVLVARKERGESVARLWATLGTRRAEHQLRRGCGEERDGASRLFTVNSIRMGSR